MGHFDIHVSNRETLDLSVQLTTVFKMSKFMKTKYSCNFVFTPIFYLYVSKCYFFHGIRHCSPALITRKLIMTKKAYKKKTNEFVLKFLLVQTGGFKKKIYKPY